MRHPPLRPALVAALALSGFAGATVERCEMSSGAFAPAGTGTIEIWIETFGADVDHDGYTLILRDEFGRTRTRSVRTDDILRFRALEAPLRYTVALDGVARNCRVVGLDVVRFVLTEGEIAEIVFEVDCA